MAFGSTEDWLSVGAAPFTGGLSLLGSPTIRKGLGDAAGSVGMPGRDTTRAPTFGETPQYDRHKFEYGGRPGGMSDDAYRYRLAAEQAQGRGAGLVNFSGAQPNYAAAAAHGANADAVRGGQDNVAGLMMARARGQVPSLASMQADRQMRQAVAAQASQAASARGAGGMALAQQGAANNIANAHGAISNQAQINAAHERQQAEQGAYNAYSGMRDGDMRSADAASLRAQYGSDLITRQHEINAGLTDRQATRNDAYSLGMTGHERGVYDSALQGGIADQQTRAGSLNTQQGLLMNQGRNNATNEMDMFKGFLGMAEGKMGTPGSSGPKPRADGGPVERGGLYLVGERGPELMVAPRDGHVVPNHKLRGLY